MRNAFLPKAAHLFGELSFNKLRIILKKLGVSTKFKSYGIGANKLIELKLSLKNNLRAGNSLVTI
jgi:hypothetical protein